VAEGSKKDIIQRLWDRKKTMAKPSKHLKKPPTVERKIYGEATARDENSSPAVKIIYRGRENQRHSL